MARILDIIKGHHAPIAQFMKAHHEDRLPATFLLVGPSGIGKRQVAWGFAQALLCEQTRDGCGVCPSCLRIEKHVSESVLYIEPEGTQIKVERGREMMEFLSLRRLGRARVVIMDQAQALNIQAGNSLLKTLEEPPEATYIFLIATSQSVVLPTIRSRAQALRFAPLSQSDLRAVVAAPEWVIASSQGRVELACVLADESWAEVRGQALGVLVKALTCERVETTSIKDVMKDKTTALFTALMWQKLLRDICVHQAGSSDLVNVDMAGTVAELAQLQPRAMTRLLESAMELEGPIHGNVDRTLLVENFLMKAGRLTAMNEREVLVDGLD